MNNDASDNHPNVLRVESPAQARPECVGCVAAHLGYTNQNDLHTCGHSGRVSVSPESGDAQTDGMEHEGGTSQTSGHPLRPSPAQSRHAFVALAQGSKICGKIINGLTCGKGTDAPVHLSDDIVDDRAVPFVPSPAQEGPERIWIGDRAKYLLKEEGSCLCYSRPELGGVEFVRADLARSTTADSHLALIEQMRNALEPFAQAANAFDETPKNAWADAYIPINGTNAVRVGDLRRCRTTVAAADAALKEVAARAALANAKGVK